MFRPTLLTLALCVTAVGLGLPETAEAQGTIYVRPDGNGYYYHSGPSPLRPPAIDPYVDDAVVHEDLGRREYERQRIYDTGARYGNLTSAQRAALGDELRQSGARDDAYHSGYHRGRDVPRYRAPSYYRTEFGLAPFYPRTPLYPRTPRNGSRIPNYHFLDR